MSLIFLSLVYWRELDWGQFIKEKSRPKFENQVTFGQGQRMTLASDTHVAF